MENSIGNCLLKLSSYFSSQLYLNARSKFMEVYHVLNEVINYSHIALRLLL